MSFQSQENARRWGIEKMNEQGTAAKFIAKAVKNNHQQKSHGNADPQRTDAASRTNSIGSFRCRRFVLDHIEAHGIAAESCIPAPSPARISKRHQKSKTDKNLPAAVLKELATGANCGNQSEREAVTDPIARAGGSVHAMAPVAPASCRRFSYLRGRKSRRQDAGATKAKDSALAPVRP